LPDEIVSVNDDVHDAKESHRHDGSAMDFSAADRLGVRSVFPLFLGGMHLFVMPPQGGNGMEGGSAPVALRRVRGKGAAIGAGFFLDFNLLSLLVFLPLRDSGLSCADLSGTAQAAGINRWLGISCGIIHDGEKGKKTIETGSCAP
jgi:hypothetical protein